MSAPDAAVDAHRYYPVCDECVRGEGSECHQPACALWMRDVPPDGLVHEFGIDPAAERAEARREALEEAARVCERTQARSVEACARAIRARALGVAR